LLAPSSEERFAPETDIALGCFAALEPERSRFYVGHDTVLRTARPLDEPQPKEELMEVLHKTKRRIPKRAQNMNEEQESIRCLNREKRTLSCPPAIFIA
jgi:hypothetical protein